MAIDRFWGWELIINGASCDIDKITNENNIRNFIKELIKEIDMIAWNDPLIQHFQTPEPQKSGWSFCQMITTSAITAHFIDCNGDVYMNIFSCKSFNPEDAIKVINKYFNPKKISTQLIERIAP